jgi:putative ABC transport system permease protein
MRVAALNRKLLRELWHSRGQVISISLVVACGVMTVVTMRSAYESLEASRVAFYERYEFADVFSPLIRAPRAVQRQIQLIAGVSAVEARIAIDVNLDVPGLPEPATGRLISIPAGGSRLNQVHLVQGRLPTARASDEVVASTAFTRANGLRIGDGLAAVIDGRWERLRIVGIGMSPEYVYEVSPGQIFPDSRRFGVLWMDESALGAAAGLEGAFNDLAVRIGRGANEAAIISEIDRILTPYGSLGAFPRERQLSHQMLTDELRQNRVSGTVIPAIFLGVAAFLLHIVMSRMIRTQRELIAVLKAFGYTGFEIGTHYLRFALVAVALGAVLGSVVGVWLGDLLLDLYAQFFQFPELIFRVTWPLLAISILVSAAAAAIGALSAVREALRLPPAEAMRPEAPPTFRPGLLERIGFGRLFSPIGRMVIRSLERQPLRAAFSALAVALSISILLVGAFMFDSARFMADLQFRTVQREDLTVVFSGARPAAVRYDLSSLEGVSRVETFRSVPVRLEAGHRSRQIALTGLQRDGELRRILDTDLVQYQVPSEGVLLSAMLADIIGAGIGDTLRLQVMEGARPVRFVPVTGIVDEMFGLNAYMDADALARLMREAPAASGAYLRVDASALPLVFDRLRDMPGVMTVAARSTILENFESQLEQNLLVSMGMLIFFAGVIAVGVIYNSARIALSERGRELASLRVMGFTRREVAVILFGEQATVTALGIPVGFLVGLFFASSLVGSFASESYRIPLVVNASTYAFAGMTAVAASIFAGFLVRRRLNQLDLIAVLKTRE